MATLHNGAGTFIENSKSWADLTGWTNHTTAPFTSSDATTVTSPSFDSSDSLQICTTNENDTAVTYDDAVTTAISSGMVVTQIQADSNGSGDVALYFGWEDTDNFLVLSFNGGNEVQLIERSGGSYNAPLAETSVTRSMAVGSWEEYRLEFWETSGTVHARISIGGTEIAELTTSSNSVSVSGGIGIGASFAQSSSGSNTNVFADATEVHYAAPADLAVAQGAEDELELSWSEVAWATSYDVLRAESSGAAAGDYSVIDTVQPGWGNPYTDTNLEDGERFYYRVEPNDGSGNSAISNEDDAITVLPAGTSPTATKADGTAIDLAVTRQDDSTDGGWELYRSTDGTLGTQIHSNTDPTNTTYTDSAISLDTKYHYTWRRVTDHSSSDSTQIEAGVPTAPTNVRATNATGGDLPGDTADVAWDDNSTGEDGYRVLLGTDGSGSLSVVSGDLAPDTTTYSTSSLLDGEQYWITVEAFIGEVSVRDTTDALVTDANESTVIQSSYVVQDHDVHRGQATVTE